MSYCTVCGKARVAGGAYCTVCGAPQPSANAAPSPPAAFVPVSAPVPLPPVAARGGSGLRTFIIGGDTYNLDLSKRRAAAVKEALVTRYHIAPDRLANDGYGASRPVETNDTLEGRARNRRVELTRE